MLFSEGIQFGNDLFILGKDRGGVNVCPMSGEVEDVQQVHSQSPFF